MLIRRITAILAALALVLVSAPRISAQAGAAGHFAELGHDHSDGTWTPWGDGAGEENSLPTVSGRYYLTRDITPAAQHRLNAGQQIELCMNGHSIISSVTSWGSVYQLSGASGVSLKIKNCADTGVISRSVASGSAVMGSTATADGSIELINVVFDGIDGTNNGTCLTIQGTTSLSMTGCAIRNCSSTGHSCALFAGGSGMIALTHCDITNNTWTQNETTSSGLAPIRAAASSVLTFDDCSFTGNSGKNASVIYAVSGAQITLKDCSITGNTSANTGATGAVYTVSGGVTIEGATVITGNTDSAGAATGLTLQSADAAFHIKNTVDGTAVELRYYNAPAVTELADITGELAGVWTWLADPSKSLVENGCGALILTAEYPDHAHGGTRFAPWTSPNSLPSEAGAYFLTCDVILSEEITINEEVLLCLDGHTVTSAGRSVLVGEDGLGIFVVNSGGSLAITDCSEDPGCLTGGDTGCGGAIYLFPGASLDISNIRISGNTVSRGGGAIYAKSATDEELAAGAVTHITADNVTFTGNTCTAQEGNVDGGVLFMGKGAQAELKGCTFTGNKGKNASVIYALGTVGGLTLDSCTVTDNTCTTSSSAYSGAVYMIAGGLTLRGANVINDNYYYSAGYSYFNKANLTIQNAEGGFDIENSADSADVRVKYAVTKEAGRIGSVTGDLKGTYAWTASSAWIFDAAAGGLFLLEPWTNTSSLPDSGAYYLKNNVTVNASVSVADDLVLCLHGKTIAADINASAYTLSSDAGLLLADHGEGGFAVPDGIRTVPLISAGAGVAELYGLSFNSLSTGDVPLIKASGSADLVMTGCVVTGVSSGAAGAVLLASPGSALIEECTFTGNTGTGGAAVRCEAGDITFKNNSITGNTVNTGDAGEYGAVVLLSPAAFEGANNIAANLNSGGSPADVYIKSGAGFILRNAGRSQTIGLTSQDSFTAESIGSIEEGSLQGIYQWTPDPSRDVTASGTDIVLTARSFGNLVYGGKTYAPWTSYTSLPASNKSSGADGWYLTGDVTVTASTSVSSRLDLCLNGRSIKFIAAGINGIYKTTGSIINIVNNIPGSGGLFGSGPASLIFTSGSSTASALISLSDVTIADYTNSDVYGHAVVIQGAASIDLTRCSFERNTIDSNAGGAALYLTGTGTAALTDCTFDGCSAAANGGAIYCGRTLTITGCSFNNCSSGGTGGAIYCFGAGALSLSGSAFAGCSSGASGGGAAFTGSGDGLIEGNTFTGCSAGNSSYGGGIYVNASGAAAQIRSNSISGCTAGSGGAIAAHAAGNSVIGGASCPNIITAAAGDTSGLIYVLGSSSLTQFGDNTVLDNTFAGRAVTPLIEVGPRGVALVSGVLDASAVSFGPGGVLSVCDERATLIFDGAKTAVTSGAPAVTGYGTVIMKDSEITGSTLIDARYNMWMIQMDAMLIAEGNTRANVTLTQNSGSWYASQEGGSPEKAILMIQGENLTDDARIDLTIPRGGDAADYVFGPATVRGRGTSYTVTKGIALPGFDIEYGTDHVYAVTSVAMSIESMLAMSYYVATDDPLAQARFYVGGSDTPVPDAAVTREATLDGFVFTLHQLSPASMTLGIRVEITDGGGAAVTVNDGLSIAAYLDALYRAYENDNSDFAEALKQLIADLVRYGDAAQQYVGSTAPLPSAGREWLPLYPQAELTAPAQNGFTMTGNSSRMIRAARLTLGDKADLKFTVAAAGTDTMRLERSLDGSTWTEMTPEIAFSALAGTDSGDLRVSAVTGGYEVCIPGIAPGLYGEIYRLTAGTACCTYSVNSYIYAKWNDPAVGGLVRCMHACALSAMEYSKPSP